MVVGDLAGDARIANVYGHGFGRGELARLQELGFELRAEASTYPGSQLCSFLDFARGPALELIEVLNAGQYLDFVPRGMEPYSPGISLVAAAGIGWSFDDLEREFRDLHPYRLHVSYDGSTDPEAPGWNYLNFGKPIVQGTFVWCTTFDEPRPIAQHRPVQRSVVDGVVGLVFDLPMQELQRLAELTAAGSGDGVLRVGEIDIWAREAACLLFPRDKSFPLVAVVLEAPSLHRFAARPDVTEITFASQPAVLVRTNGLSWDLVIRS